MAGAVLGIWSLVLLCNMIAEAQGFRSAWAGFGNLVLAGMVIIVPLVALVVGGVVLAMVLGGRA